MKEKWSYYAKVLKIVDADTVDVEIDLGFSIFSRQRLRLADIDAWEVRGVEREKGLEAKAFVDSVIPVGSTIYIETNHEKGKYGRYIATIWYGDGINLCDKLVNEGHAETVNY